MTNCINEKRLLPEEVEQSKPQAGRYMSEAEIDADRLKLIEFCAQAEVDLGIHLRDMSDNLQIALAKDHKESLTRIAPENNSPK